MQVVDQSLLLSQRKANSPPLDRTSLRRARWRRRRLALSWLHGRHIVLLLSGSSRQVSVGIFGENGTAERVTVKDANLPSVSCVALLL